MMTLEKSFILSKLLCPHLNNIDNNRVTYRVLVSTPLSLICSLVIMCMCVCVCVCVCVFSCLTLCDPMDGGPPGFSVHGISQAMILE